MDDVIVIPPSAHAEYSASGAHRWGACAGSQVLVKEMTVRRGASEAAAEGTVAHYVAAECWTKALEPEAFLGKRFETEGYQFTVDREMAQHVQVYLDSLKEYALEAAAAFAERKVQYDKVLNLPKDQAWGTADFIVLRHDRFSVHDLKFGRGVEVNVEDNDQLALYALGVMQEFAPLLGYGVDTQVTLVIHQPRIRKAPQEVVLTAAKLQEIGERLRQAVHLAKAALWNYVGWKNEGKPAEGWDKFEREYLSPGEKQCQWCKAKPTCSAVRNEAARTVLAFTPVDPDEFAAAAPDLKPHIAAADDEWLAAAAKKAPLIESWLKAVRLELERRVLAGHPVPGFKPVTGPAGDRAWDDPEKVEHTMKHSMRLRDDVMYKRKLISPAQAELLTKGKEPAIGKRQWEALQESIKRADGRTIVVPDADPRPAVTVTPIEDEFEDLSNTAETLG